MIAEAPSASEDGQTNSVITAIASTQSEYIHNITITNLFIACNYSNKDICYINVVLFSISKENEDA